ncbi:MULTISPECIES: hypothetical protein [unclassified Rhodococcus (in: high G+C Gram-positive bacteria)]|uniref:hypothetical protein n=1 Tax=unclassified Rhodococcus (in: high G+C Gram-positive bacteria) TaxID=192944 RepID=UPI000B9BE07B|nr:MULTISPECIES: hypothetical protein [unclassified Rhodococcus (in: high G+C Gram-positive bacteria)]OZE35666.1 hypothetical protein CH259_16715 [Rhodococcus sp. 05-2254-4]OZE48095.1 hypothetical protein CH261_09310 [Rhodococcus sp. 05-2254-3]OZE49306.1 hypothetical protein CH283_17095 [Rhodococcus sp. 05-2254-2]
MSEPLDLDALEARASKATDGPWNVYDGWSNDHSTRTRGIGSSAIPESECVFEDPYLVSTDADFIAHSRTDVPALIARVRELEPLVLEGDWETVRDALDALPEGAQIRWTTGDPIRISLAVKIINVVGNTRWSATDGRYIPSESIARDETPIEVIA